MIDKPVTIFFSAAEASGDEHAAHLIRALRSRLPNARFVGAAGEKMAKAGCEVLADLTHNASMLGGPILRLGYWIRTVKSLQRKIKKIRPALHVPVDSPAMNWHLARAAKQCGSAVVYYIAPQVWAWASWRAQKLARLTDHVACILPFEEDYFRRRGVNATYVGHPLFEALPKRPEHLPDILSAWADGTWRVALLPGSRPGEIHDHAPAMVEVARKICSRWPAARCTFTARSEDSARILRRACRGQKMEISVGKTHEVLAESHFAVAVSGTVTLEAAYFGVPMVIFYRVNRLGYRLVAPWLIRTPHLSLVNILAGRGVVPELIPWYGGKRDLTKMVLEVMNDLGCLLEARQELLNVVKPLESHGPKTASENAADLIVEVLDKRLSRP